MHTRLQALRIQTHTDTDRRAIEPGRIEGDVLLILLLLSRGLFKQGRKPAQWGRMGGSEGRGGGVDWATGEGADRVWVSGDRYLLELLYDFLKGGLQLLRHRPLHGCQLGKGTILLHAWQHSVTHYNQPARHVHTYESRHNPLSS